MAERLCWCQTQKLFVGEVSFANLPTEMRDRVDTVPTRLKLPEAQVDLVIEASRLATRLTPEYNGFLASLTGNDVDQRIEDGIAAGGYRVVPVGN